MSRKTETKEGTLGLGDFNGKDSREMIARKNSKVGILTGQIEVPKQKGFLSKKQKFLIVLGIILQIHPLASWLEELFLTKLLSHKDLLRTLGHDFRSAVSLLER